MDTTQSNASEHELTPREKRFIASLLKHGTMQSACDAIHISHDTGQRYMQRGHVRHAYNAALDDAVEMAIGHLSTLVSSAVGVLGRSFAEPQPSSARIRAASFVIEQTLSLRVYRELNTRMDALEAQVQEQQEGILIRNGRLKPRLLGRDS